MSNHRLFESYTQSGGYSWTDLLGKTQYRHVERFIEQSASQIDELVRGQITIQAVQMDLHERCCRFSESYIEWFQKIESVPLGTTWKALSFRFKGDPIDLLFKHVTVYENILKDISRRIPAVEVTSIEETEIPSDTPVCRSVSICYL